MGGPSYQGPPSQVSFRSGVEAPIRPKKDRNGTRAKGDLFQTLSDKISQLFSPLTSLAHQGCFVEF